jgi:hypothetical protein
MCEEKVERNVAWVLSRGRRLHHSRKVAEKGMGENRVGSRLLAKRFDPPPPSPHTHPSSNPSLLKEFVYFFVS